MATEPMPKALDISLSITDFVSPSHWLLWAIDKICGVNPAEWLAQQLAGDWESISKFAGSLGHVGEFYTEYAKGLREGQATMLKSWDGNAADACDKYFTELANAIEKQVEPIQRIAGEIQSAAYGVWSLSKAAVSGLEALMDLAVMIAIEAAAAAAVSWTVVGPSVAMAVIMAQIGLAIQKWLKIIGYVGLAVAAVFTVVGLLVGGLAALCGLDSQPYPKGSYDNLVVA
ncbi:WXG100 family type VII secretion target [Actinomadura spongiicola]|uniref:WXG100 family type VII secretion target n=2 Tax=Actinomadura spongiicola TaxID=2303421 RepID=A0A372GK17_9ACTN|nr:WXG100 family type VII secretion target [Actinomadura spongiicola]